MQGRNGGKHTSVFPEHVPHAAGEHRWQLLKATPLRIPQRLDPEQLARPRTLGAALVVAGGRQRAGVAGVERNQSPAVGEHQRHRLDVEIGEVDAQRGVGFAIERGELVEQAGVRAQPLRSLRASTAAPARGGRARRRRGQAGPSTAQPPAPPRTRVPRPVAGRRGSQAPPPESRPPRAAARRRRHARSCASRRLAGHLRGGDLGALQEQAAEGRGGQLVVLTQVERVRADALPCVALAPAP